MPDQEPPADEYFSRVYLRPVKPRDDSERFRVRLAAYSNDIFKLYNEICKGVRNRAAAKLLYDLGIQIPRYGSAFRHQPDFEKFFLNAPIEDVLDSISALHTAARYDKEVELAKLWQESVGNIFNEEHLSYRVNDEGGVRKRVDEEFERNREALIAVLGLARYEAVATGAGRAYDLLAETPSKASEAIRAMFAAVEDLTKLIVEQKKVERLNDAAVDKGLKPIVEDAYAGDASECIAAVALLAGLKAWVKAGHQYRHGQGREAPREAPFEFAVAMLSSGASYLRWLAEIDRKRNE